EAEVEQPLGDVTYWFARRDAEGRPRGVWERVRFFLMRWRGGRFGDRDREMDAVRWFSLDEAEQAAAFENERALVRRARTLLAGVGEKGAGAVPDRPRPQDRGGRGVHPPAPHVAR